MSVYPHSSYKDFVPYFFLSEQPTILHTHVLSVIDY
jgi:hypothetical protein